MRLRYRAGRDRGAAFRERCEGALAGLMLPSPFSVREFCKSVEAAVDKRIAFHEMPVGWAPAGMCGLLVETDLANHIYFTQQPSVLAKATAILHECGHILIQDPDPERNATLPANLPAPRAETVKAVHGRTGFSEDIEATVELFASMVLDRGTLKVLDQDGLSPSSRRLVERFG